MTADHRCPICGALNYACGGGGGSDDVHITDAGKPGPASVIVQDVAGNTYQFSSSDASKFISANPGAQIVEE